mmetsp:Transcript_38835/g.153503  ORF Transcript_38835/g.153503 Transcript_38835/m.153503 type:complete len:95 (+) Transcript_38835:483-767(+)
MEMAVRADWKKIAVQLDHPLQIVDSQSSLSTISQVVVYKRSDRLLPKLWRIRIRFILVRDGGLPGKYCQKVPNPSRRSSSLDSERIFRKRAFVD